MFMLLCLSMIHPCTPGLLNPLVNALSRSISHADKEMRKLSAWISSIQDDLQYNVRCRDNLLIELQKIHPSPLSAVVTGALGGIGRELCKKLAHNVVNNQSLTIFSRMSKLVELNDFATQLGQHVQPRTMNLNVDNQTNVNDMLSAMMDHADEIRNSSTIRNNNGRIDLLIHNAGLMGKHCSVQDIHAVNYYSPLFLSLTLLPDMLAHSHNPVLLFVGSSSHLRGNLPTSSSSGSSGSGQQQGVGLRVGLQSPVSRLFSMSSKPNAFAVITAYADAKLRCLLTATALERRLEGTGCIVRTAHPGLVDTPMLQGYFTNMSFPWRKRFLRSPAEGAAAVLLPALTNFDVIYYTPPLSVASNSDNGVHTGLSWMHTHKDYRKSYFVNGKSAPKKCTDLVNDVQACESCYRETIREIQCANESVRTRFIARIRQAGPIIDLNDQLSAEMKIKRKQALFALALDIDS